MQGDTISFKLLTLMNIHEHFSMLNQPHSSTLCGLGFGCARIKLVEFVDQGLGLQIIFLHFSYLVPVKRRYLRKVPPVFTEKRRKKNNNEKKKNRAKKKSGNLMKRAQKNFERDPRKKTFLRAKPYGLVKAKNHELCVTRGMQKYIKVDLIFKNQSEVF